MVDSRKLQPAIFYGVNGTYQADTCEPLRQAKKRGELFHDAFARGTYPGRRLPPNILPELCVSCVWDAKHDQTWGLDMHRNEGIELGYLTRGKLDYICDGKLYHLKSGSLAITRPWQPHQVGSPHITAGRMHWLILDVKMRRPNDRWHWPRWMSFAPKDIARLTELLSQNEHPVWQGNQAIEDCFENIAACYDAESPEQVHTRLQLLINQLFLEVYEMLQKQNVVLDIHLTTARRNVEIFLESLPKHVDYAWTLDNMAKHCNLGRTRFAHYCQQITNKSPIEYLTHCRVEAAKRFLKQKDFNITEVAFTCGFESSQYFANTFKRLTGCSPRDYRAG